MAINLDQDLLRTLVTIVDSGTFANAARRLHRTPSGVSMQMRKLEEVLNKPVFQKSGRRALLTTEGEALVPYARRIIRLMDDALEQVAGKSLSQTVKFGISEDYVATVLPPILEHLSRTAPWVSMDISVGSSSELYGLVQRNKLEAAVITTRPHWPDVDPLRSEQLVWVSAHGASFNSQVKIPIALFREGCIRREMVMKALAEEQVPFRVVYTSGNLSSLIAIARTGLAIAPMARCCVPHDLQILSGKNGVPELPFIDLGLARCRQDTTNARSLEVSIRAILQHALSADTVGVEWVNPAAAE